MTLKLSRLLEDIKPLEVIGDTDKNIIGVHSDSRKVEKDSLFVAVRGVTTDGHKYIPVVASTHVGAIVCEELPTSLEKGITYIKVADSAEALGLLVGMVRTSVDKAEARGSDRNQRQDHYSHTSLRNGQARGLQGRTSLDRMQLHSGQGHPDHTYHT